MEEATVPPPELRNLFQKCFQNEAILDCKMSAGSNPGDNVIGKMVAVKLKTTSGDKHDLVVKASVPFRNEEEQPLTHEEKRFARLVASFGSYQTELAFYQRIQPGLKAMQFTEFGLPTPKLYLGQYDHENGGLNSCLILEDLRPKGYKMADKMKGLTLDEVIMVLEKIARFHASSYLYIQKSQTNLNESQEDPLTTHVFEKAKYSGAGKIQEDFARSICFGMYELGKETGIISEDLYNKILKSTQNPGELILTTSKQAAKDYFPVVIHGDLWVNNILFKYDDQAKPIDVSFIDFQQCRYSSVFDELHYFIYTSTTAAFRKQHLKGCLDFYFEAFHKTLKGLYGSNQDDRVISGFTKEAFLKGYQKFLGGAFCYGVIAVPFQVGAPPSAENADFSSANGEENGENNGKENEIQQDTDDQEEFRKFIASTFENMGNGLIAAARNSPVALKRFSELCMEMDEMGVFK